jgi:hypothetical protein
MTMDHYAGIGMVQNVPVQGNRVKEAAPILARNAGSGSFAVLA